ncbi:hypothetical protein [Sphingomonas pokkalii]|uniref:hypothetical protein n=1 Tax=Sphingomonas pokkalii TaxID=2175090 RepID=UPI0010577C4E|nr:hypothetical protein [Sphingomonas pokkalii]
MKEQPPPDVALRNSPVASGLDEKRPFEYQNFIRDADKVSDTDDIPHTDAHGLAEAIATLSAAVLQSTGNTAFLAAERIHLIDAAHKLAWLLVRVRRVESKMDWDPDLASVIRATHAAAEKLRSVYLLGEGEDAVETLLALALRLYRLLPETGNRNQ